MGNVPTIERMWTVWTPVDLLAWLEFFDPAVVWYTREDEPDAGVYRGHEGIGRLMQFWSDNFDDLIGEAEEHVDAGEYVVSPSVVRGKGKVSGAAVELAYTFTWRLRDGKIVEVREYLSKQDALAALAAQADSK